MHATGVADITNQRSSSSPRRLFQRQLPPPASARTYAKWRLKLLCFGAACLLAGGELAMAQAPRYRILIIDPPSGINHSDGLGLNEDGAVVGRFFHLFTGGGDFPFVWFLNSSFGQSAKTLLELNDLDADTGDPRGIARDINADGLIIGERHLTTRATVWDLNPLPSSDAEVDDLGTFPCSSCSDPPARSSGFHINDDDPPVVVGWSDAKVCEDPAPCPGALCADCPSGQPLPRRTRLPQGRGRQRPRS